MVEDGNREGMDRDAEVRQRAYELWQRAGSPWGREHEFWAAASREIEGEDRSGEVPPRYVAR